MKLKLLLSAIILSCISFAKTTYAVCPVCVVAIGGGVGLCRWLGLDDVISGLWIGALIISMIIWTLNWFNSRNIRFKFRNQIVFLSYYLMVILPLYSTDIMGHPLNTMWGMDKILLGIIMGSFIVVLSVFANSWLKTKNGGKVFFPYQRVVVPIVFLLIASLILHFIIGCKIKIPF